MPKQVLIIRGLSQILEHYGLVLMTHTDDVMYKTGNISGESRIDIF